MSATATRKGRTSKKSNGSNSQAKLKYINSCVKNMIDSLPRQTFSQLVPFYYETPSSFTPIVTQVVTKKPKRSKKTPQIIENTPALLSSSMCNNSDKNSTTLISNHPLFLNYTLMSQIPIHPNIHFGCAFCNCTLETVDCFIEQPHARRRFTPLCKSCLEIDCN